MDRGEFEALRGLQGKTIEGDVHLTTSTFHAESKRAKVSVNNSLEYDLTLDITYKPKLPGCVFNFSVTGIGPICRLEVNCLEHKDQGRTHKHEVMDEGDPSGNLPCATAQRHLDDATIDDAWRWLCEHANITHHGVIRGATDDRVR